MTLLDVRDLAVSFTSADGIVRAVRGVSFSVDAGRTLGIVGESGSGKSVATQSIVRLTRGARVSGDASFDGRDLLRLSTAELRTIRGAEIGMIFQDPLSSLHPYYTVGWQIEEMLQAHRAIAHVEARRRAIDLLGAVGIPRASERVDQFPHQFSGGMRQRAMIAMAMVLDPPLIVADEPTTGLDVIVQDQIMQRLKEIQERYAKAILLITHDMAVVAENCNRIVVMYAGKVAEAGGEAVFRTPFHPYTLGLCNAFPDLDDRGRDLISIRGTPPSLVAPPQGCRFHQRCPFATALCAERAPPLVEVGTGHVAACHYIDRADEFRARAREPETWTRAALQA
jgi:peptide/nickel transport system ATP-binding protein